MFITLGPGNVRKKQFCRKISPAAVQFCGARSVLLLARALCQEGRGCYILQPRRTKPHVLRRLAPINHSWLSVVSCQSAVPLFFCSHAKLSSCSCSAASWAVTRVHPFVDMLPPLEAIVCCLPRGALRAVDCTCVCRTLRLPCPVCCLALDAQSSALNARLATGCMVSACSRQSCKVQTSMATNSLCLFLLPLSHAVMGVWPDFFPITCWRCPGCFPATRWHHHTTYMGWVFYVKFTPLGKAFAANRVQLSRCCAGSMYAWEAERGALWHAVCVCVWRVVWFCGAL